MKNEPQTLTEAIRYFSDPEVCFQFMVKMRWVNGTVTCPTCGSSDLRFISTRKMWVCKSKHPRQQFSVKVGTIFEDSPLGLDKWLAAMWMIANDKNGVSSYEIHRAIGVTQKTAWFMLHRIRLAMQDNTTGKLAGTVEADETYIGGKARFMHKDRRAEKITGTGGSGKTAVMGLLERHGPDGSSVVRTEVVKDVKRKTLAPKVRQNVEPGSEVFTDALKSYNGLEDAYIHEVIDHTVEYVRGKVHTNGMENFWSLLKRAIRGTYVNVGDFHLFRYLDEEAYRFNHRKDNDHGRFCRVSANVAGKRLSYQQLIGATDLRPVQ